MPAFWARPCPAGAECDTPLDRSLFIHHLHAGPVGADFIVDVCMLPGVLRPWRLVVAALCLGLAAPVVAQSSAGTPPGTLAVVEGVPITEDDVAAIVQSRGRAFSEDPAEASRQALAALIAETAIEVRSRADGVELNPAVAAAALDARRQVLFQYYAQSRFQPTPPTPAEIDAYIAENSYLFEDRIEYRFVRFFLEPQNATDVRVATEALTRATSGDTVAEGALDALTAELAVRNIPLTRQLFWNGSEVIEAADRERLEAMRAADLRIDIRESEGFIDAIILLEARPAPVDAALLRPQIADRLIQEKFQAHRAALIDEIADPFLEAATAEPNAGDSPGEPVVAPNTAAATDVVRPEAGSEVAAVQPSDNAADTRRPESTEGQTADTALRDTARLPAPEVAEAAPPPPPSADPPEQGGGGILRLLNDRFGGAGVSLAGFGLFGFAAVFSVLSGAQWIWSAWRLRQGAEAGGYVERRVGLFDRFPVAVLGAVAGALVLALAAALVVVTLPWETRATQLAVLGAGGAILGVMAGLMVAQSRPVGQSRPIAFGLTLAGGLALLVTGTVATMI